ncbi:MAG: hypothetical protein IIA33_07170, partial [Planctomycetes bacterium]|nr:hypothetical protein [Planctomycetota bacterium]
GADDGCGDGETCGGRNQGDSDCCEEHDGSGCDDNQCQDQVCAELESCCDHDDAAGDFVAGVWDAACAAKTFEICCAFLCEDDAPPAPCVPTGGDNDDCANSQTICDGCTPFSTIGNTTDGLEHLCPGALRQSHQDEWYNYIATCTGELTVSTCNDADFDTVLVAYAGCAGSDFDCSPGDPELLGCNDDAGGCAGFTSELAVPVTAGNCYTIRVGGFGDGDTGSGNLCLACGAPGSNSRTSSPGTAGGDQAISTGGSKGQESGATNTSGSATCGMLGFAMLAFLFVSIVGLRLNRSRLSGVRKP